MIIHNKNIYFTIKLLYLLLILDLRQIEPKVLRHVLNPHVPTTTKQLDTTNTHHMFPPQMKIVHRHSASTRVTSHASQRLIYRYETNMGFPISPTCRGTCKINGSSPIFLCNRCWTGPLPRSIKNYFEVGILYISNNVLVIKTMIIKKLIHNDLMFYLNIDEFNNYRKNDIYCIYFLIVNYVR